MKKLLRSAAMLAFGLGMVATFSACHSGEDAPVNVVSNQNANAVLVVTSNQNATVVYGGQTLAVTAGQVAVMQNAASQGNLVATPTDAAYMPQTVAVKYAQDQTTIVIDFNFVKQASQTLSQADVAASTGDSSVSNDQENQDETGDVVATITVPAGTTVTNGVTDDYSIVVFSPASGENIDDVEKNDEVEAPLIAVACDPDGAVFNQPVQVSVKVPGSDGLEFYCQLEGSDEQASIASRNGDVFVLTVPHFSVWDLIMKTVIVDKKVSTNTLAKKTATLTNSRESIVFNAKYGFESDVTGLVAAYLKKCFGGGVTEMPRVATVTGAIGQQIEYTITQDVVEYTFQSGSKTFKATVYGDPKLTYRSTEPIYTHGGGSN